MYDYRQLSLFWQSIRPIQGSTKFAVQFNGQTIIPQDFDFVQKDGVAYIYDKVNDKLYDQYLNYYQNGTYFDSTGVPKTEVKNDNIIDVDPGNVYKHTPHEGIEYFDSDGNSLGFKKKPKYKPSRGPRIKQNNTSQVGDLYDLEFDKKRLSRKHQNINLELINEKFEQLVQKDKRFLDYATTVDVRLDALVKDTLGIEFDDVGILQKGDFNFTGNIFSKHSTLSNTYYIDNVQGKRFAPKFEKLKKLLQELGFEHIQLDDQYRNPATNNKDKDYWGERGFNKPDGSGDVGRLRTLDLNSKEETIITIEDDNTGVKTETSSTKDTNIPDSSTNQNNAESIKQQEPINNSDKSKPNFTPIDAEYSKYVWEEYQKGNTDVMSAEEYYRSKHTPEEQAIIDEINNRPQQLDSKSEQNAESTPKTNKSTPNTTSKPDTTTPKPQPEVKPKSEHTPKRGPKVKSANITKEQIEKITKQAGMKMKSLANDATEAISEGINWNKVGKVGAVVGVAALVGFGVHKHNEKEKENKKYGPDKLTGATRKSEFWNQSYTAQMAKDISTYQYGKRMTGFIQG